MTEESFEENVRVMKNFEPRLYDVKVSQLQQLDKFVDNPDALDRALGTKLDAQGDEHRLINAARALFGLDVEKTLWMLKEGQPGFHYATKISEMLSTHHSATITPAARRQADGVKNSSVKPQDLLQNEAGGPQPL